MLLQELKMAQKGTFKAQPHKSEVDKQSLQTRRRRFVVFLLGGFASFKNKNYEQ